MRLVSLLLAGLVLGLSAGGSQAQVSKSAIAVTPPADWVMSVYKDPPLKLGEFTPKGQTGGAYVDLLGFSAFRVTGPISQADVRASFAGQAQRRCGRAVEQETDGVIPGWVGNRTLCVGRKDQSGQDLIETTILTSGVHLDTLYSVWRSWRGSQADYAALLKEKAGLTFPATGAFSDAQGGLALEALAVVFAPDLARFELCDLTAPKPCSAFSVSAPDNLRPQLAITQAKGEIVAALYADGTHVLSQDALQTWLRPMLAPGAKAPEILVSNLTAQEFMAMPPAEVGRILRLVHAGGMAKGGALIIYHPAGSPSLSKEEWHFVRHLIALIAPHLWKEGASPGTTIISMPTTN